MKIDTKKLKLKLKDTWNFFVGLSSIISCIVSILSCYIAFITVSEIISLNIEINPIVEKLQKDSIVIIEKHIPRQLQNENIQHKNSLKQPTIDNSQQIKDSNKSIDINNDTDTIVSENNNHLSSSEFNNIRTRRDLFLKRKKNFGF